MKERYDVFTSYSRTDSQFIREWLIPRLEEEHLMVCVDYRDFDIGAPSLANIEQALERSLRTILVLTPNWIQSQWCEFESLVVGTAMIPGFGKWSVRGKRARRGRDPQTGKPLVLDERRVVTWKYSPLLRKAVNR